ncbi:efflux RND transporter permease subunit [Mangrovibacterium diazotrophicum]|uniref:HAE1 family hydrophobic/amphiphilic exporter-1 n=1 Tax=Mangrovibacterium diazotrophicum TaxID=1261403 RepID=A0A419WBM1_9BACT|nr:efflux RND transporter permease subunit [Mangrovibacterium diazotrophicum]RKD92812.1 HAE1 family hydrophobic/amphiphilic exporter-1 [Mangrovibacterium diazotrophicum]
MKKLSEFSVKFPVTIFMIIAGIVLLGVISYDKLGIDLFPNLNNPRLYIELTAGERPPEEIEKQFVENLEALAIRQSDVTQVSSISKVGSAQITVEYAWNKDMEDAFLDLQKAVSSFSQNEDLDEINITQYDPNTSPVLQLGLSNDNLDDMNELRKVAENYIRNELIRLEGVAEVEVTGDEEPQILIETNQYLLDAFGLTLDDISTKIGNFNESISGGTIEEMGTRYVVKGVSLLTDVDDFENVIVGYKQIDSDNTNSAYAPIFLREVAKVSVKNKDPENIVRLNGQRCLGLSVYKETKFNTVKAVDAITEEIGEIEKALPGYHLTVVSNQGNFISSAIGEVKDSALLGIFLAIIVLFVFLRRIGSTLIISIAIPISIIATFNLMYFNDLTLNIMTLGGLALGAGMLVDNAIVVMENIFRNRDEGMSVRDAAIIGTSQVSGAITASTLTTIVVFLPIVYLHGASGELFKDQAWTVAFSLISSLAVAILLIPMLFNLFYKNKKQVKVRTVEVKGYGRFLDKVLKNRYLVIVAALAMMGLSVLLVPMIGTEFMPKTETREFSLDVHMAEGTRLQRTSDAVRNIETIVTEILGDNLQTVFSQIGPSTGISTSSSSIFEGENTATVKIILKPESTITSSAAIRAISNTIGELPDTEISYKQDETALKTIMGTDDPPLVVEVQGEDLDVIQELVAEVKTKIDSLSGIYNVESSMEGGSPEIEIMVDRMRAGMHDISVSTVVSQIENQLTGLTAGQVERQGELQDITLKLPDKSLKDLSDLRITSDDQEFYVNELATVKMGHSPKEIYRRNQNRIGKLTAQLDKNTPLDKAVKEVKEAIAPIALPLDYKVTISGEEAKRQESMQSLGFALLLSIVLVYMVLASQFESLLHPFTILLTIPLAVVGSILIFFLLGKSFNMMAFIGIIMLAGIAVNNSIILVDRILQLRKGGLTRHEAILQAGQQRIRPIMMTSLTTILALVPLTLGIGESASLRSPMALAVIGGMVTSTLLSLVVIPCVYDLFESIKDRFVKPKAEV